MKGHAYIFQFALNAVPGLNLIFKEMATELTQMCLQNKCCLCHNAEKII